MGEYLSFVDIDTWELIFTWVNLLILFLLMKKFLFKPVRAILDKREEEVRKMYDDAEAAKTDAAALEAQYSEKLAGAQQEAREIVETARRRASEQSGEIVSEARNKAADLLQKANVQIESERKDAVNEIKSELSSIAVDIAGKVIERDINEKDHEKLIQEFIDGIGEAS